MAITLNVKKGSQTFLYIHAGSIDNVIVANSTNINEPNFRYIFEIELFDFYDGSSTIKLYIQPNPYGYGIFNPKTIYEEFKRVVTVHDINAIYPFIFFHGQEYLTADGYLNFRAEIRVYEGYDVSGVFTEDPLGYGAVTESQNVLHGKRGNLLPGINRVDGFSTAYTDVDANTFYDRVRHLLPANLSTGYIYLPCTNNDQGVLVFNNDDATYIPINNTNKYYVKYIFYDYTGAIVNTVDTSQINPLPRELAYIHAYPKNVGNFIGLNYDTRFYSIQLIDSITETPVSKKYLVVIECPEVRYDNVRLAWIGENGGFEYFNFPQRNERTYEVERKQYTKPFGNYGTVGAGISETDAGLFGPDIRDLRNVVNRAPNINTYLDITSDWLTETEFNYLKSLLIAEHIYKLEETGFKTVVIENKTYLERRERNTKKYSLKLTLRYGQVYEAIDYAILPPPPVPCEYYDIFTSMGGSTGLTLSTLGGNALITAVAAGRSRYIVFSITNSLGQTLVPGTFYYVSVTLDSTMPASNYDGYIQRGDDTANRVYFDGNTLTFLASGIWGTHTTSGSNYMRVKLPNFLGGATWSGTITITVGTDTCPD